MIKSQTENSELEAYKAELNSELNNILEYWATITPDKLHGGFYMGK